MNRNLKYAMSIVAIFLTVLGPDLSVYARGGGRGGGGGGRAGGGGARMSGGGGRPSGGARPSGGMSRPSPSAGRTASMSRPSAPSRPAGGGASRPAGAASRPAGGGASRPGTVASRPAGASRPGGSASANRPSTGLTPGSRPGSVDFARPSTRPAGGSVAGLTPGTRPATGGGPSAGQLPTTGRAGAGAGRGSAVAGGPSAGQLPAGRGPGAGQVAGGRGPAAGQLPAGKGPGAGQVAGGRGPAAGQLPAGRGSSAAKAAAIAGAGAGAALLPGLGNRPGADGGRPGIGDGERPGGRPERPSDPGERRDDLQGRLDSRDDFRDQNQQDRQDYRDDVRQDWQDHYGDIYDRHDDWHHGFWHGDAGDWWSHMWDDHTALMAFGTTMWGINRAAYGFGYWGYENPYYTESYPVGGDAYIDYSQPIVVEESLPVADTVVVDPAITTIAQPATAPTPGIAEFEVARQAFYQEDYPAALASANKALAAIPGDPIIHEFRALVQFAQRNYKEAAAGLYSVLSAGPGWDWTTLSSLYPSVDVYTKQLRGLEDYIRQRPQASDARFVLAYHYLTTSNKDAATAQLKELNKQSPQDPLIAQLLLMTGGPEALGVPPGAETTAPEAPAVPAADLVGNWAAKGERNTKFAMELSKDGNFSWTYTEKGKPQTVKGVYAVDGNVLAMEPESGGVMLAEVTEPKAGGFGFKMLGAPPGDPGLTFVKGG